MTVAFWYLLVAGLLRSLAWFVGIDRSAALFSSAHDPGVQRRQYATCLRLRHRPSAA
jgi:hypothetical protein